MIFTVRAHFESNEYKSQVSYVVQMIPYLKVSTLDTRSEHWAFSIKGCIFKRFFTQDQDLNLLANSYIYQYKGQLDIIFGIYLGRVMSDSEYKTIIKKDLYYHRKGWTKKDHLMLLL